jgi:hypothetical protein
LESMHIPESVEILEKCCFSHCPSLNSVVLEGGSRLTKVGKDVFEASSTELVLLGRR